MSVSKYLRIGLRADKNLADLPSKQTSLGNILDDLIPNQSFIPGDLQVINGLNTTNIWAEDLKELVELSVQYSPLYTDSNGNLSFLAPVDIEPRIRAIDKIKNDKVILGDPPYKLGGKGPIAKVFPSGALISPGSARLSHANTIAPDDIFDASHAGIITTQEYWMDGRFGFNQAFHPTFGDSFGGISWTGWLSNGSSRKPDFECNSFFLIEKYNSATTTWETVKCVAEEEWTATVLADNSGDTTKASFNQGDRKHLMIGVQVGTSSGSPTHEIVDIDNADDDLVTLQALSGAADLTLSQNDTLYLSTTIGDTMLTANNFRHTDEMAQGDTQQVRITVWYPKPADFDPAKTVPNFPSFGMRYDLGVDIDIVNDNDDPDTEYAPYNYFYENKAGAVNAPVVDNTFTHFSRNVLSPRNKSSSHYFLNEQPVYHRYTPKLKVNEVSRFNKGTGNYEITSCSLTWRGNTRFTGADSVMREIEVGDILLFTMGGFATASGTHGASNDHFFLQVSENNRIDTLFVEPYKFSSQGVAENVGYIMTQYGIAVDDVVKFYVVDSKGLIGLYSQINTTVSTPGTASQQYNLRKIKNSDYQDPSLSSTDYFETDIRPGDLFANLSLLDQSNGNAAQQQPFWFEKITTVDYSPADGLIIDAEPFQTSATPSPSRTKTQYGYGLVYAHRGLTDLSTITECVGVIGHEVASTSSNSANVTLLTIDGIQTGMKVYFAGIDPNNPVVPDGTTVQSINTGTKTVTLSNSVSLNQSVTLVFAPSTSTSNKEGCIMPLNTAPPFVGTDTGLETSGSAPHLVVGGDFEISGIKFDDATSVEVTPSTDDADGGLLLKTPDGTRYWALTD